MKPTDKLIPSPDIVLREEFDDWALLFHTHTGEVIGTSPVGVAIWKLLDGTRTLEEVARVVKAQCEDAPDVDTVLGDTLTFADDLQRRLFVVVKDEGQGRKK